MMEALAEALNAVQDEGRRNLRALRPWQVRKAEPYLETMAYRDLACDMHGMRIRQSVRENAQRRIQQARLHVHRVSGIVGLWDYGNEELRMENEELNSTFYILHSQFL